VAGWSAFSADKVGAGAGLTKSMKEYLDAHTDKVEIMLETPAKSLVTNDNGDVIGVIATSNGKDIAIQAKRGVVLGTGGFDWNKDMMAAYMRGHIYFSAAVPTNTGDGQIMGMAIGADLRNMNSCWGLPGYVYQPVRSRASSTGRCTAASRAPSRSTSTASGS